MIANFEGRNWNANCDEKNLQMIATQLQMNATELQMNATQLQIIATKLQMIATKSRKIVAQFHISATESFIFISLENSFQINEWKYSI